MSPIKFSPQLSVAVVLKQWPQSVPVFLRHRMLCIGCGMAAFDTLEEAAELHGLSPDLLTREVSAVIDAPDQAGRAIR